MISEFFLPARLPTLQGLHNSILLLERTQALRSDEPGTVALEPNEFAAVYDVSMPRTRQRHPDFVNDPARTRAHDHNPIGEEDGLLNIVGHE
jgi:hypothetical protein